MRRLHASWRLNDPRIARLLAKNPEALVSDLRPDRVVREVRERDARWVDGRGP